MVMQKKDLSQDRAAEVDVGEQGDAEADHILAQDLALAGAVQSDSQGGGAGHGADSSQVSGAVVAEDFPGGSCRSMRRPADTGQPARYSGLP